jgi:peptide/nickel transport system substrate-binding protein
MLAAAGYPDGISLTLVYRSTGNNPKIAATLQQDLKAAGITLNLKQVVDFYDFLYDTSATKSGQWDIAAPGWNPDWEGSSERSFFSPLLDGRTLPPHSSNYGLYNDPAVNTAADNALHTADQASSVAQWNAVDGQIMQDAPWVPLVITPYANYHSSRAKNFQYYFGGDNGDLTNLYVQ